MEGGDDGFESLRQGGQPWQRPDASRAVTNFDLKAFFTTAVTQGVGLSGASYLLGVQAGFEVWQSSQPATTNSFGATIN